MLQSHAVAREAHIRMKLQNRAAHCEVKSTNLTSKSRIQEKIAATVTEGPSILTSITGQIQMYKMSTYKHDKHME